LSRQTELIEEKKEEVSTENQAKELDESDHCLDAASSSSLTMGPLADETAPSLESQETMQDAEQEQTRPLAPGIGISDTRWDTRASTLRRYARAIVLKATVDTINHVIDTTDDPSARATAIGLEKSVRQPRLLLLLVAFQLVLEAVNTVSNFLQTVKIDIAAALVKTECLKSEIQHLRTEEACEKAKQKAYELGRLMDVDIDEQLEDERSRRRKLSRRPDEHAETEPQFDPLDALCIFHYYKALDKLIAELEKRFLRDFADFKFLHVQAEAALEKLARRYKYKSHLKPDEAARQWRIFRHTPDLTAKTLAVSFSMVPDYYSSLKIVYQIFFDPWDHINPRTRLFQVAFN